MGSVNISLAAISQGEGPALEASCAHICLLKRDLGLMLRTLLTSYYTLFSLFEDSNHVQLQQVEIGCWDEADKSSRLLGPRSLTELNRT